MGFYDYVPNSAVRPASPWGDIDPETGLPRQSPGIDFPLNSDPSYAGPFSWLMGNPQESAFDQPGFQMPGGGYGQQQQYGGGNPMWPSVLGGYPQAGPQFQNPYAQANMQPWQNLAAKNAVASAPSVPPSVYTRGLPQQAYSQPGVPGGASVDPLAALAANFQNAQNQAFQANQQRYNQIMQGYGSANNALTGQLTGMQQNQQQGINDLTGRLVGLQTNQQQGINALAGRLNAVSGQSQQGVGDLTDRLVGMQTNQQNYINQLYGAGQQNLLGYANRMAGSMNLLQGLGQSQTDAINRSYDQNAARGQQGLISRGLYNSTVSNSINRGNEYDRQAALQRANEGIQQQALGVYSGTYGDYLGSQQRFNDQMYGAGMGQVGTQGQVASQLYGANQAGLGLQQNIASQLYGANQGQVATQGQVASQLYGANQNQVGTQGQVASQLYGANIAPLNFMNSVTQSYPSQSMLGGLANSYGAAAQSFQNAGMLGGLRARNNAAMQKSIYGQPNNFGNFFAGA